ncbi:MAG: hypothetical protein LUC43_09760 [Burkholderiales bacterium]|nr:hypothetical protein [Burkholderiales bacterium]
MYKTYKIISHFIFLSVTFLAFALMPFQAMGAEPTQTEESKPLLGLVTLGKTTIQEFVQAVKAKGCSVTSANQKATVAAGCFKLPGNPTAVVESINNDDKAINLLVLTFQRNSTSEVYDSYRRALTHSYGEPTEMRTNPLAGRQTAVWKKQNVDVFIHEATADTIGTLLYATPQVFETALKAEIARKGHVYDLDQL